MDPPASASSQRHHGHDYPDYVDLSDLTDEQQSSSDTTSSSEDSHGVSIPEKEATEDINHHNSTFETHTPNTCTSTGIERAGMEQVTTTKSWSQDRDGASGNEADIDSDSSDDDSSIISTINSTSPPTQQATARNIMPAETTLDGQVADTSAACTTGSNNNNNIPSVKQFAAELMQQQYDPSRMELSQEEHRWALAVKDAIAKLPDLDPLSDFMIAQIAIISKGDMAEAIDKTYRLQRLQKDNNIMDTFDDGMRNLPNVDAFLSMDYNLSTGGYIFAMDITKTDGNIWKDYAETCAYNRRAFYAWCILI